MASSGTDKDCSLNKKCHHLAAVPYSHSMLTLRQGGKNPIGGNCLLANSWVESLTAAVSFKTGFPILKDLTIESKIDISTQNSKEYWHNPLHPWTGPYFLTLRLSRLK